MIKRIFPALVALIVMLPVLAFGQVSPTPSLLNFQGRLARPDGTPVPNGTYSLRFSLHDAVSGGVEKWNQTLGSIPVRNGTFAVLLSGFSANAFSGDLWMEIKIGTNAPLTPRQQLVSVAYAMKANSVADGVITGASIANGTLTANKFAPGLFDTQSWRLGGNSGTNPAANFVGTLDGAALELRSNNSRGLRLETASTTLGIDTYSGMNVLGGFALNNLTAGVVAGTIAGGGYRQNSDNYPNHVTDLGGTIGGGAANQAGDDDADVVSAGWTTVAGGYRNIAQGYAAAIGGGEFHVASGFYSVVGGGLQNIADGRFAAIPGGLYNAAGGVSSFAAGSRAKANHDGAFVWGDTTDADFASTGNDQFLVRARGGVGLDAALNVDLGGRNNGTMDYALTFGGFGSGEGLGSKRTSGGNQYGLDFYTDFTSRISIANNGNVGIGASSPTYKLQVNGSVAGVGNYNNVSDARYKQNIATFPNALDAILNLRGVTFDWKPTPGMNFSDGRQIGFIAQEVEKVLPELVTTDKNGYKSVAYANVVPVLVEAMKAQEKRIQTVESENTRLKATLENVLRRMEELESNSRGKR